MNAYNIISYLRRGYFIFPSGMFEKRFAEFLIVKKNRSSSRDKETCEKGKKLIDYTFGHGKFPLDDIKGFEHINFDNEECLSKLDQQLHKTLGEKASCSYEECTEEKFKQLIDQIIEVEQSAIENETGTDQEEGVDNDMLLESSNIIYYQDCDDAINDNTVKVVTFRPTWPPTSGAKKGPTGLNYDNKKPGNNKQDNKDNQNHIQPVIVTTATTKADIPEISIDYRITLEPYINIYKDEDEDITIVAINKKKHNSLDQKVNEPEKIRVDLTFYSDAGYAEGKNENAKACPKENVKPEPSVIPTSALQQSSVISCMNHNLNKGVQQSNFELQIDTKNINQNPEPIVQENNKLEASNKFEVWENCQNIINCHRKPDAMRRDSLLEEPIKKDKTQLAFGQDTIKEELKDRPESAMRPNLQNNFQVQIVTKNSNQSPEPTVQETYKLEVSNKYEVWKNWQDILNNCHQKHDAMRLYSLLEPLKKDKTQSELKQDIIKDELKERTESAMRPNSLIKESIKQPESEIVIRADTLEEKTASAIRLLSSRKQIIKKSETKKFRLDLEEEPKQEKTELEIKSDVVEGPKKSGKTKSHRNDNWKDFENIAVPVSLPENSMPNLATYGIKLDVPKVDTMDPLRSTLKRDGLKSKTAIEENSKIDNETLVLLRSEPISKEDSKAKEEVTGNSEENLIENASQLKTSESRPEAPVAEPKPSSENVSVFDGNLKIDSNETTSLERSEPITKEHSKEITGNSEENLTENASQLKTAESRPDAQVAEPKPSSENVSVFVGNLKTDFNETTLLKRSEPTTKEHSKEITGNSEENLTKNASQLKTAESRPGSQLGEPEHSSENVSVFAAHSMQPEFNSKLINENVEILPNENKAAGKKETTINNEIQKEKKPCDAAPSPLSESELIGDKNVDLNPYTFPTESKTIKLMNDQKDHSEPELLITETKAEYVDDKNKVENTTLNKADEKKDFEQENITPQNKPIYRYEAYSYQAHVPYGTFYTNYTPQCCYYVHRANTHQQSYQRYFLGLTECYRHSIDTQQPYSQEKKSYISEELNANPSGELNKKPVQVIEAKPEQVLNTKTALGLDAKPISTQSNINQPKNIITTQSNLYGEQSNPIVDTQSNGLSGKYLGRGSRSRAESVLKRRLPVETSTQRQLRNRRRTKHENFIYSGHVPLPRNLLGNEVPLSVLLERAREKNRMEYCQLYESLKEQEKVYEQLKQTQQTTSKKGSRDKSPPSCPPPSPTYPPPEPPRSSPPMNFPPMGRSPKFCPPKKDGFKFLDALNTLSVYDNDNTNDRSAKAGKRREYEKRLLGKKGPNHWIFVQGRAQPLYDAENILECSKLTREEKNLLI